MTRSLSALVLIVAFAAGCGTTYSTGTIGSDLSAQTAAAVKPHMTKREVTVLLGTPTNVTKGDEGREIWSYRFWKEWNGVQTICHPFGPDTRRPVDGSVYVWFASDGTVAKVFRDENPR